MVSFSKELLDFFLDFHICFEKINLTNINANVAIVPMAINMAILDTEHKEPLILIKLRTKTIV